MHLKKEQIIIIKSEFYFILVFIFIFITITTTSKNTNKILNDLKLDGFHLSTYISDITFCPSNGFFDFYFLIDKFISKATFFYMHIYPCVFCRFHYIFV